MMKFIFLTVVLVVWIQLAYAEADPEAEPEAFANALADPDKYSVSSYGSDGSDSSGRSGSPSRQSSKKRRRRGSKSSSRYGKKRSRRSRSGKKRSRSGKKRSRSSKKRSRSGRKRRGSSYSSSYSGPSYGSDSCSVCSGNLGSSGQSGNSGYSCTCDSYSTPITPPPTLPTPTTTSPTTTPPSSGECPSSSNVANVGCTAEFFYLDLSAIHKSLGQICATSACFVKGSCPSYSTNGTAFEHNSYVNSIIGAFGAKIATPELNRVCYTGTICCASGFAPVDLRLIDKNLGVVCAATTASGGCSSNNAKTVYESNFGSNTNKILGAISHYLQCVDPKQVCWYPLTTPY